MSEVFFEKGDLVVGTSLIHGGYGYGVCLSDSFHENHIEVYAVLGKMVKVVRVDPKSLTKTSPELVNLHNRISQAVKLLAVAEFVTVAKGHAIL